MLVAVLILFQNGIAGNLLLNILFLAWPLLSIHFDNPLFKSRKFAILYYMVFAFLYVLEEETLRIAGVVRSPQYIAVKYGLLVGLFFPDGRGALWIYNKLLRRVFKAYAGGRVRGCKVRNEGEELQAQRTSSISENESSPLKSKTD